MVAIEIVALLVVVGLLLWQYAAAYVPWWVRVVVYGSWLSCFSIVLILPIDVFHSLNGQPERMLSVWRLIYWATFLLAWVVLPVVQEYEEAGEFSARTRLVRSLRNNLLFYAVVLAVGAGGLVYLLLRGGFTFGSMLTYAMAAGNLFGLLVLVVLLAHGIPELPKSCWRQRSLELKLRAALFRLALTRDKNEELFYSIEEKVADLKRLLARGQFPAECNAVLECVPESIVRKALPSREAELTLAELVQVHKEVKFSAREYIRGYEREKQLAEEGLLLEDIIRCQDSPARVIESDLLAAGHPWLGQARWLWHCRLKHRAALLLMGAALALALVLIIAEVSIFVPAVRKANPLALILAGAGQSFVAVNLASLLLLLYICYCVFSSLFEIKLAGYYGLYGSQQTDGPSLLFSALNCTRVTFALCYNFLQLSGVASSAFTTLMGQVDIFPVFGANFRYVIPILLLVLIAMNSLDLYSKLLSRLGLKQFVFAADFTHEQVEQGRKQLALARQSASHSVLARRTTDLKLFKAYDKV